MTFDGCVSGQIGTIYSLRYLILSLAGIFIVVMIIKLINYYKEHGGCRIR
jgi:hypothetical protein